LTIYNNTGMQDPLRRVASLSDSVYTSEEKRYLADAINDLMDMPKERFNEQVAAYGYPEATGKTDGAAHERFGNEKEDGCCWSLRDQHGNPRKLQSSCSHAG